MSDATDPDRPRTTAGRRRPRRAHIEIYRSTLEQRGLAASTIDRRLSTVCGYYRFANIDGPDPSQPSPVRAPDDRGNPIRPSTVLSVIAATTTVRPESYVGSCEHHADISGLAIVAPEPIRRAVATYSEFLTSGAPEPADPDSNLTENWPTEVRTAIEQILEFNAATC